MSEVDFLKDSHEISSSYSDSSEVGDLNIGCDFQNLHHIRSSQKNKIKLAAFSVATFLIKWEKKANPSLYKIVLETLGGVNVGNVMQRPEKLTVFAAKTWNRIR